MSFVKVKFNDRILKLKPSSTTSTNLAMIFKLDVNKGIFLHTEEQGEIILPDEAGNFVVEDVNTTYVVNGDAISYTNVSFPKVNRLGLPLSYQQSASTSRSSTNPPPGPLMRPKFTSTAGASTKCSSWKKSFMVVEVNGIGKITDKFQIHLSLTEENASVNGITEILKDQLGFDVTLLDSKYLPIVNNDTTKGSQFWRSSRKINVIKTGSTVLLGKGKNPKRAKSDDYLEEIYKKIISENIQTEKSKSTTSLAISDNNEAKQKLLSVFKCPICLGTTTLPAAVCSRCYVVIGCVPCIEQWYESSSATSKCPLCRTKKTYSLIPMVREIATILGQEIPEPEDENADDESTTDTIDYNLSPENNDDDDADTDADLLRPMI